MSLYTHSLNGASVIFLISEIEINCFLPRYMNTSEVNFAHCMKMTAYLTNLNVVGMGLTGKERNLLCVHPSCHTR